MSNTKSLKKGVSDTELFSKKPMVSVQMITYNHEKYIAEAIEGVLKQQTSFRLELVIGEDCSTDSTREICEEYSKKYQEIIKLLPSGNNLGMMRNGIRTLKACRGKYIALCEGDDYWTDPLKLQKQVDFLEANPEYGLVHTDGDCYYHKDYSIISNYIKKTRGDLTLIKNPFKALLKSEYPVLTCSVMLRSSILQQILKECAGDMMKFKMNDTFIWLEFMQRSKVYFIAESMVRHNILIESAAHSRSLEKILNFKESGFELVKYFVNKYKVSNNEKQRAYASFVLSISILAYKLNSFRKIKELTYEKHFSRIVLLKLNILLIGLRTKLLYKPVGFFIQIINLLERKVSRFKYKKRH